MSSRPTRALASVLFFTFALVVSPGRSSAEQVLEGVELYDQARFEDALRFFEALLRDNASSTSELTTAHLYVATLLFIDGEEERAARHAAAAAALDPDAVSPPGAPAGVERLLRSAAAEVPAGGMQLDIDAPRRPSLGEPLRVRAVAGGAPEDLVAAIELHCESGAGESEDSEGQGELETELTLSTENMGRGDEVTCFAETRMAGGALLQTAELEVSFASRRRTLLIVLTAVAGAAALAIVIGAAAAISQTDDSQVEVGSVSLGHQ